MKAFILLVMLNASDPLHWGNKAEFDTLQQCEAAAQKYNAVTPKSTVCLANKDHKDYKPTFIKLF